MNEHVVEDLFGRVDVIISSKKSKVGLESTVLDITGETPVILRPGIVTQDEISKVLGSEVIWKETSMEDSSPRAPGMKYRHYAPFADMTIFSGQETKVREEILEQAKDLSKKNKVGILSYMPFKGYDEYYHKSLSLDGSLSKASENLFEFLREFDKNGIEYILAEEVPSIGIGEAIMNRLRKASNDKIKYL